jgi:predicted ATPase
MKNMRILFLLSIILMWGSTVMGLEQYVLTGGPRSGKTSLLLALEWRGENVIQETAIDYIMLQQARGIENPWEAEDFQDQILDIKKKR